MINSELNVFLLTCMSPMLLMVSKQGWCHFEALECIFHLNLKKFPPSISWLTINQIQRFRTYGRPCSIFQFPTIWGHQTIKSSRCNTMANWSCKCKWIQRQNLLKYCNKQLTFSLLLDYVVGKKQLICMS